MIDGPFAETKELIAGYWVQAKSMDEAIEWVKRVPFTGTESEIEIRQVFEADDSGPRSRRSCGSRKSESGLRQRPGGRRPRRYSVTLSVAKGPCPGMAPSLRSG